MNNGMSWPQALTLFGFFALVMGSVLWGVPWLVGVVGPVLSNAVLGLPVAVLAVLGMRGQRREYRKIEADGDPDPLRPPFEYESAAKGGRFFSWIVGGGFIVLNLALAWHGNYSVLVPGLLFGMTLLAIGQEEVRHARAMDTRLREESAKGE